MISIPSKVFGNFEVDKSKKVHFNNGIPGLESVKEYVFVAFEEYKPISWMISTIGEYHFPVAILNLIDPEDLDEVSREEFLPELRKKLDNNPDLLCYVIIKLDESVSNVNLKAPIIVDSKKRTGQQLMLEPSKRG